MLCKSASVAVVSLMLAGPAMADPLTLFATSLAPGTVGDFSVQFDDTGDGRLDLNEVTGSSGLVISGQFYANLVGVPDITAVSDCGGASSPGCFGWLFESAPLIGGAPSTFWSYRIASVAVPEPGTLALFGLGIAGIALVHRRNQRPE